MSRSPKFVWVGATEFHQPQYSIDIYFIGTQIDKRLSRHRNHLESEHKAGRNAFKLFLRGGNDSSSLLNSPYIIIIFPALIGSFLLPY